MSPEDVTLMWSQIKSLNSTNDLTESNIPDSAVIYSPNKRRPSKTQEVEKNLTNSKANTSGRSSYNDDSEKTPQAPQGRRGRKPKSQTEKLSTYSSGNF